MATLTSGERFRRMFEHREADRVPVLDGPWRSTIERWQAEGMPSDTDWVTWFGLDHVAAIGVDNSPRYPVRVVEETDQWVASTTPWGVTLKQWKHADSTPEFLDFTIVDRASWAEARARMQPARDRVDWARLAREYPRWRERGDWIEAHLWFGFDVTHSWIVGTERLLMALYEDPEWCVDMFNHHLDLNLALLDAVWDEGYRFDCVMWCDDMGFKGNQFFSVPLYRELLKPVHRRAVEWAHAKGVYTRLHSCGYVEPFIPEYVDIGVDALNPLEVKAGMDPCAIKRTWGDRLVLHGGINAVLWTDADAIEEEMRRVVPVLKEGGGYIFASDHSIPSSVSLADFQRIIGLALSLGRYG